MIQSMLLHDHPGISLFLLVFFMSAGGIYDDTCALLWQRVIADVIAARGPLLH